MCTGELFKHCLLGNEVNFLPETCLFEIAYNVSWAAGGLKTPKPLRAANARLLGG